MPGIVRAGPGPERPRLAVPRAAVAPKLQGAADDPAWGAAAEISRLRPSLGSAPGPVPQRTSVRVMWDARFLYIRFVCEDDDILATLRGRDAEYDREDAAEVFLDPVGDGREYIELQVSPNNGVRDVLYLCTAKTEYDAHGLLTPELLARDIWSFDAWTLGGLRTAAGRLRNGKGWFAELAIPASSLRRTGRNTFGPVTLRANFIRLDHPKDPAHPDRREFVSSDWSPVMAGRPHRSPGGCGFLNLVDFAKAK